MQIYWEHIERDVWVSQQIRLFDCSFRLRVHKDDDWKMNVETTHFVLLRDVAMGAGIHSTSEALEFAPALLGSIFQAIGSELQASTYETKSYGT